MTTTLLLLAALTLAQADQKPTEIITIDSVTITER